MRSGAETWMESSSSASGGSTLRSARTTNLGGLFEFEFEFSSTELSAVPISGFTVTGRDSDIFLSSQWLFTKHTCISSGK